MRSKASNGQLPVEQIEALDVTTLPPIDQKVVSCLFKVQKQQKHLQTPKGTMQVSKLGSETKSTLPEVSPKVHRRLPEISKLDLHESDSGSWFLSLFKS